jgi:hypothetical protein
MPPPRRRRRIAPISLVLALATTLLSGTPANAVDDAARNSAPIVGGSQITIDPEQPAKQCTAGAVLLGTSYVSLLTPYFRAVRYVLTAGHCGGVGLSVTAHGIRVGRFIWISADSDLGVIRIEPTQTRRTVCRPTVSGVPHCTVIVG